MINKINTLIKQKYIYFFITFLYFCHAHEKQQIHKRSFNICFDHESYSTK